MAVIISMILPFLVSAQSINKLQNTMKTASLKKTISDMYETVLNKKQSDQAGKFIDERYIVEFNNQNKPLFDAFPDIHFTLKDIFEEGNKVITVYEWKGIHLHQYKNIAATQKTVTIEGVSVYEFRDGKIVSSTASPDKLSFYQQLGVVPDLLVTKEVSRKNAIYFVDEFQIPSGVYDEFKKRLDYNRNYIRNLKGFLGDEIMQNKDLQSGIFTIITIAVWKDRESLNNAKESVHKEYEKIGFDPAEFSRRLNIKMKRAEYYQAE